jgi:hypothetical protein
VERKVNEDTPLMGAAQVTVNANLAEALPLRRATFRYPKPPSLRSPMKLIHTTKQTDQQRQGDQGGAIVNIQYAITQVHEEFDEF